MRKGRQCILAIVTALAVMLISVVPVNAVSEEIPDGFAGAEEFWLVMQ